MTLVWATHFFHVLSFLPLVVSHHSILPLKNSTTQKYHPSADRVLKNVMWHCYSSVKGHWPRWGDQNTPRPHLSGEIGSFAPLYFSIWSSAPPPKRLSGGARGHCHWDNQRANHQTPCKVGQIIKSPNTRGFGHPCAKLFLLLISFSICWKVGPTCYNEL